MGCVFSCFAQSFLYVGELLENIFLALGEILSVLTRGIFSVLVGICDVLAAASCCWRVPYDQRPDRGTFVYSNAITKDVGGGKVLGKVVKSREERARKREELLKKGESEREKEGKLSEEEGATPGAAGAEHGEKAVEAEGGDKPVKPAKEPFAARFFGGNKASSKKVDGSPAAATGADTDATTATATTAEDGAAATAAPVDGVHEQPATTAATAATSPAKAKRSFWGGGKSNTTKPAQVDEAQAADAAAAAEPTAETAAEAPTVDASAAAASGTAAPASSRIQEPRGKWFFGGGKTNVNGTPAAKAEEAPATSTPAEVNGAATEAEAAPGATTAAETPAATDAPAAAASKAPSKKGFGGWKSKKADKPAAATPAAVPTAEGDVAAPTTTAAGEDKPTETSTAATESDAKPKKDDGLKRAKTTLHTLWHGNSSSGSGKKKVNSAAPAGAGVGAEAPAVPEKEGETAAAPAATIEGEGAGADKAAA